MNILFILLVGFTTVAAESEERCPLKFTDAQKLKFFTWKVSLINN